MRPLNEFLLEQNMDRDLFDRIRDVVCANWNKDVLSHPGSTLMIEDIVFRRHDKAVSFVLPWVHRLAGGNLGKVLDFGCGSGSSSVALSYLANEVIGIDIFAEEIEAAKARSAIMDRSNIQFESAEADKIVDSALSHTPDIIIMYAVVEHLLEAEKIEYLRKMWKALPDGGLLVIVETPNRLAYTDTHTFELPFFHLLPDEISIEYMFRSARPGFADDFKKSFEQGGWEAFSQKRHRAGLGVSYHEFEIAFGEDLSEILVGDGFDDEIIWFFPLGLDDHLLLTYFDKAKISAPAGFARSVLSLAFRKPRSQSERDANREDNMKRSARAINTHSMGAALAATERRVEALSRSV